VSLQLDLFEDVAKLPWHGRSPRTLTRGANGLFLRHTPLKTPEHLDAAQMDLFRTVVRRPRSRYSGAPLMKVVR